MGGERIGGMGGGHERVVEMDMVKTHDVIMKISFYIVIIDSLEF